MRFAAFGIGDEELKLEIAMLGAEVVGDAHVILDDRGGDEFALVLHRQKLVGEQKSPAVALVADDAIDPGHLADQRALEGIGQENGEIEFSGSKPGGEIEGAFAGFGAGFAGAIGDELIGPGHADVHGFDVAAEQVTDVGIRI